MSDEKPLTTAKTLQDAELDGVSGGAIIQTVQYRPAGATSGTGGTGSSSGGGLIGAVVDAKDAACGAVTTMMSQLGTTATKVGG